MNRAEDYLASLDSGRDHKAHAAFHRLVREPESPIHGGDLRPIIEWLCAELDGLHARMDRLDLRQDPNHHNPAADPSVDPTGTDPEA